MCIYEDIQIAILEGKVEDTMKLTKKAIALKYPVENILDKGLIKGINLVSEKFKEQDILIPEAFMSTRSVEGGLHILKPYLRKSNKKERVKVVMGVVAGDLHDIGKNIVKTIISTLDIDIIDLGIDVSIEQFVEVVRTEKPNILMISSLLTTTMSEIKVIIEELKRNNLRKDMTIFIGGASITSKFQKDVGADYYIEDAFELRTFLKENLKKFKW